MDLYSKGSYDKDYHSDDYYNTNSKTVLQRVNDSAEDTSGAFSQRIDTAKDIYERSLAVDHTNYSVDGDCNAREHQNTSLPHVPRKRRSDLLGIEGNPSKRYCGPNSSNAVGIFGRHTGNSELPFRRGAEELLDEAYDGRHTHNARARERADIRMASPRTPPNRILQNPDRIIPQLGSPIWKNVHSYDRGPPKESSQVRSQAALGKDTYQSYYGAIQYQSAPVYTSGSKPATNRDLHPTIDSKISYDPVASKAQHAVPTSENGAARRVMETTNLIMSQISKDSVNRSESISPHTPMGRATSPRNVACPVHTHQGHSRGRHESTLPIPQLLSYSPKSETVAGDSDELEDAPIEQLLNRMRYAQPPLRTDSTRTHYNTSDILPRTRITFIQRSDKKPAMLPTLPTKFLTGGGPTSPICIDSPPEDLMAKKSLPMKARLSSYKMDPKIREGFATSQEKQQRAAEMIIMKEQKITDKEIFGEVIRDQHEQRFSCSEAQQEHDSKENARLIKEEYKRQREREAKRLNAEAAERERLHREREEEVKKVRREAERKKQLQIDEAVKEERRRMAEEQIEASRLKEIADKEKREEGKKKEILAVTEAAERRELELKREIAKLQAASLKPATAIPKQPKKVTDTAIGEIDEEEPLFVSDSPSDSDQGYEPQNGRSSVISVKASSVAEAVAKPISLRSRQQEEREAFDAQKNAGAEKTRLENLKARLTARRESTAENSSAHRSTIRDGENEHVMKKNRSATKSKARPSRSKVRKHGIASGRQVCLDASDSLRHSVSIHQIPQSTIYDVSAAVHRRKKYSSEIKLASDIENDVQQDLSRRKRSKTDQQIEERRKKDGEKARDRQRERLVEEAAEGGYTITNDEIEKRLDAYMRKREENYRKRKEKKGSNQKPALHNYVVGHENEAESTAHPRVLGSTHDPSPRDRETHDNDDSIFDPEQQERDRNEMIMREAMMALAKSSHRGSRFANTAAKRTVNALRSGQGSEDSEESEEDPDDEPTVGSALAITKSQNEGKSMEISKDKALNGQTSVESQIEASADISAVESKDSSDPSTTKVEALSSTDQDTQNTENGPIQRIASTKEASSAESRLVRVYTVKILQIIDGEEQPPEDLNKFLDLSEANGFAEDRVKEHQSVDDVPSNHEHTDQLFRGHIIQDDKNSTQIWVVSEIISSSKIPNFDPKVLGARFPSNSWFIRFETIKDVFDENSETSSLWKVSEIIPDQHYSDIELANYAAAEYLIKFLKPQRPVIDHLEQYENEVVPEIRRVRDDRCEEKEPFQCGLEKGEAHVEWLAAKELEIEVVKYKMQGPLN